MLDCLFDEEESRLEAIHVEGIGATFGFHPERLQAHRDEIRDMLSQLPKPFMSAPGWSFLLSNIDCNGEQWTGYHKTMEAIFVLGMALGFVNYSTPREQWSANTGGAPYLIVTL